MPWYVKITKKDQEYLVYEGRKLGDYDARTPISWESENHQDIVEWKHRAKEKGFGVEAIYLEGEVPPVDFSKPKKTVTAKSNVKSGSKVQTTLNPED